MAGHGGYREGAGGKFVTDDYSGEAAELAGQVGQDLTDLQKRFIELYLIHLNASRAAREAGYSETTAGSIGYEVLRHPAVAAAIEKAQAERSARTKITQDRVLLEIGRIAFADPRKIFSWGPGGVVIQDSSTLSEDDAAIVTEASQTAGRDGKTIKIKLADKTAALTLAGKHLGMFTDKFEHVVSDARAFEIVGQAAAEAGLTEEQAKALFDAMRNRIAESANPR